MLAALWPAAPALAQEPRAPEAVDSVPDRTIATGQLASVDLAPYFADADDDPLTYAATSSNAAVAAVSVSGNILTIAGVAPGTAVVTVFASDPGGLAATQRTWVTVEMLNRAPEPVGTIPAQTLAPDQWVSLSAASHFHDPDGDVLSISAETSNPATASVTVSGDVVTITRAGTGTATVIVVARDPGGLSARQSIVIDAGGAGTARVPAPTEPRPPAIAAGRQAAPIRQPDPFPPRLLGGYVETTGHTLAAGRGHVSAGYLGAVPAAQFFDFGDLWPLAGQASYGVTDDLTLTAGSGVVIDARSRDSELFPYLAPKFRAWSNERASVAIGAYAGWSLLAEETGPLYGGSVAGSAAVTGNLILHASGGMAGYSLTSPGETDTDRFGVVAAGGDFRATPKLALAAEYRRVGIERGTDIVTAALRVLGRTVGGEAGLAYYFDADAEIRPIVSVAYRF
ncbi:MAG: hypothetical protein F4068_13365 [Gemmatimonadetes bacterium]|nr:hypothetical protein [Gemmatimonadota bacterium]MYJ39784.1 hypothetical protein [Gemmatimonadota bacterium]